MFNVANFSYTLVYVKLSKEMSLLLLLALLQCSHSHFLSGYICPTCPSDPNPSFLDEHIHKGYDRVIFAFIGWKSDGTIITEYDDPDNSFILRKEDIEAIKSQNKVSVFISIGGGDGSALQCDQNSNNDFIDNFVNGVLNITNTLGFDGVDFDIEHRSGDYVLCAELIAKIMDRLYANNLMISMAPQVLHYGHILCIVSLSMFSIFVFCCATMSDDQRVPGFEHSIWWIQ